jgi:hypothetical protein
MSAEEPNSHLIMRRVTKAWEFKDRRLRYYDFEKDEFDFDSSRFLLTADTSYGAEVEKLLNLHIETHLASYLHTISTYPLAKDLPWLQRRAMILTLLFQSLRLQAGAGYVEALDTLRKFLQDVNYLEQFAQGSLKMFRFIGGQLGAKHFFFFPSQGIAALPLFGLSSAPAMMFVPTGPRTFFGAIAASLPAHIADEQVHGATQNGLLSACSVGLTGDRVIVPEPLFDATGEKDMKTAIQTFRSSAKKLNELRLKANVITGL